MNENKLIKEFDASAKAKKQGAMWSKLIVLFSGLVVLGAFIFAYLAIDKAMNTIIVVERSGQYLERKAEDRESLIKALLKTTCANLVQHANSFDRMTVKENQARALFYCNKADLQRIFNLYNQEKSYHEALEMGTVYKCEIESFGDITGQQEPFGVTFTSILTIIKGNTITKFRITSQGTLIGTTAHFPENSTGFFFNSYQQSITRIIGNE